MNKSLVIKDPKRGPAWSLSVVAAGAVAVGTFLWLTPHDPHEQTVPAPRAASLAPTTDATTDAVEVLSYCESSESGPAEIDYRRLDALGVDRARVDIALASMIR